MRVKIVTKQERQANHLRCIIRKMGFYYRKQVRKNGACNYNQEIDILGKQARTLMIKLDAYRQSGLSAQDQEASA